MGITSNKQSEDKIFINEDFSGNAPIITKEQNKIILLQLEKFICKIYESNGNKGTGFLCKIPFPDQFKLLPVLITNNHVIKEEDLQTNKIIEFSINDDQIHKKIKINSRIAYTNENLDVTIIEIKPDIDQLTNFLDIDENIYNIDKDNIKIIYKKDFPLYILQYPLGLKSSLSLGVLKDIYDFNLQYFCSTDFGSSGSPIFNLSNFKVIGVHKRKTLYKYNEGTFIYYIIEEFNKNKFIINKNIKDKDNNETYQNKEEEKNEIIFIYKFKDDDSYIDIFGNKFVETNIKNCKIIINKKEITLCSRFPFRKYNCINISGN